MLRKYIFTWVHNIGNTSTWYCNHLDFYRARYSPGSATESLEEALFISLQNELMNLDF